MLHAYCDESHGEIKTTPVYVFAGFVGTSDRWQEFESLWHQSMKELRIRKIGCHASKCAPGAGPYQHMTPNRRYEIQHRLIVDIVASRLYGVIATIDMEAYRQHKPTLLSFLAPHDRQYYDPHVRAVEQCIYQMCKATAVATDEPIAFVVDQNAAVGGSAKAAFNIAANNPGYPYRARLGSFTQSDRMHAIGLQAADILAYAAYRRANAKGSGKPCWQWKELRPAIKNTLRTGPKFWATLVERFRAVHEARLLSGN